ncbi:MAG: DUF2550 domain-containing protein [Cellulomonadaceae bacterium]|jgi:hypothetical protein|nr:DUF2550 domain-containing protein [Cellulomonadaceae bacterium]
MSPVYVAFIVLVSLLALAVIVAAGAVYRVRALARRVGSFPCHYRTGRTTDLGAQFAPGIAHYASDGIEWYSVWSLRPYPRRRWNRQCLTVRERTDLPGRDGVFLVRCTCKDTEFDLTMSQAAYAGLCSWLEAAPPAARFIV